MKFRLWNINSGILESEPKKKKIITLVRVSNITMICFVVGLRHAAKYSRVIIKEKPLKTYTSGIWWSNEVIALANDSKSLKSK